MTIQDWDQHRSQRLVEGSFIQEHLTAPASIGGGGGLREALQILKRPLSLTG